MERRIAPATVLLIGGGGGDATLSFTDADGDDILVTLSGSPGDQVTLADLGGGDIDNGDNIDSIVFNSADGSTGLTVDVTAASGNGAALGGTIGAAGTFSIGTLSVEGKMDDVTLGSVETFLGTTASGVNGNIGNITFTNDTRFTGAISAAGGSIGGIEFLGSGLAVGGSINADRNLGPLTIGTALGDSVLTSTVTVGGVLTGAIDIDGRLGSSGLIEVAGGDVTTSVTTSDDFLGTLRVTNGHLGGQVTVGDDLKGVIEVTGAGYDLTSAIGVAGNLAATARISIADWVTATGSVTIGGAGAGLIDIGGRVAPASTIQVNGGDFSGTLNVGERLYGDFLVTNGHLSGDVTIGGHLRGAIEVSGADRDLSGPITIQGDIRDGAGSFGHILVSRHVTTGGSISVAGAVSGNRVGGAIDVNGDVYGDMTLGSVSGTIDIGGRVRSTSLIQITNGDLGGSLDVGDRLAGVVQVANGHLSATVHVAESLSGGIEVTNGAFDLTGTVTIDRNISGLNGRISVAGDMTAGSSIAVGGTVSSVRAAGAIDVAGDVYGNITIANGVTGTIDVDGRIRSTSTIEVTTGNFDGVLNAGTGPADTLAGRIVVADGDLNGIVNVTGRLVGTVEVTGAGHVLNGDMTLGGISAGGGVIVDGDVTRYALIVVAGDITSVRGAGALDIGGNLYGDVSIGGSVSGTIDIADRIRNTSFIEVTGGDFTGVLNVGDRLAGSFRVTNGDLGGTVDVGADLRGDIQVLGLGNELTGDIRIGGSIAGTSGFIGVSGEMDPSASITVAGGLTSTRVAGAIDVEGRMHGTILLQGLAPGVIDLADRMGQTGVVQVTGGDYTGTLNVGSHLYGLFQVTNGDMAGTVNVGGSLAGGIEVVGATNDLSGTVSITNDIRDVGTKLGHVQVDGAVTLTGSIIVGGNVTSTRGAGAIDLGGDLAGRIAITGNLEQLIDIGGRVVGTGGIAVGGNMTASSWIWVTGDVAGDVSVGADFDGLLDVGGSLRGHVAIGGAASGTIDIVNRFTQTSLIEVTGGDFSGTLNIGGRSYGILRVTNGDLSGTVNAGENFAGVIDVAGGGNNLSGDISIVGMLYNLSASTGYIKVGGDITSTGSISVGGDIISQRVGGAIDINGNMEGTIDVTGDLSGSINITGTANTGNTIELGSISSGGKVLAAVLGDVEVMGDFFGTIGGGATANGGGTLFLYSTGNTIDGTVYRSGGGVTVTGQDLTFNGVVAVIDDLDVP